MFLFLLPQCWKVIVHCAQWNTAPHISVTYPCPLRHNSVNPYPSERDVIYGVTTPYDTEGGTSPNLSSHRCSPGDFRRVRCCEIQNLSVRLRRVRGWSSGIAVGTRCTLFRVLLRFVHIVVVIFVVEVLRGRRTAQTERLALAVVEARDADALAARVGVEPAIARRSHRLAWVATPCQWQACRHVGDRAVRSVGGVVHRDQVITVTTNFTPVRIVALCHAVDKPAVINIRPIKLYILHRAGND